MALRNTTKKNCKKTKETPVPTLPITVLLTVHEDDHIAMEVTSYEKTDVNNALDVLFYGRKCSVTKQNR